jgi:hypothetical protein
MNNEQVTKVITEVIQLEMPGIIEKVIQKLNKPAKKKWSELTTDDLERLIESEDYKDRCRAAAHPEITVDQIYAILENEPEETKRQVIRSLIVNPNLPEDIAFSIFEVYPEYKAHYYVNHPDGDVCVLAELLDKSKLQSNRKKIRKAIDDMILHGFFDNINYFGKHYLLPVLFEQGITMLIKYSENRNYNIAHFAKVKLQRKLGQMLEGNEDLIKLLMHYDRGLPAIISSTLNKDPV